MSSAAIPGGGTTKSVALTPVPAVVVAVIDPEAVAPGTVNERAVVDAIVAVAVTPLSLTVVADGLKFAPVTETTVPLAPLAGANDVT